MLVIEASLAPEQGALVVQALDAAMDRATPRRAGRRGLWTKLPRKRPRRPAEPDRPYAARRADALVEIAESYLATGPMALSGGDRYEIVVHVDHDAVTRTKRDAARSSTARGSPPRRRDALPAMRASSE